jgi:hypothetical protein
MDNPVSEAYLAGMLARVVTMLALLSIAVVTTVASAHAARMSLEPEHALYVGEMMHASVGSEHSCDDEQRCGSGDTEICELVCAGFSVFLTLSSGEAEHGFEPDSHDFPFEATHVSHAPGLIDQPPKIRLL